MAVPLMAVQSMFPKPAPLVASVVLGVSMMMTGLACADALKDEIAPTGKLRVAIAISPAGGAFWSTKNQASGYAGVAVDLGKEGGKASFDAAARDQRVERGRFFRAHEEPVVGLRPEKRRARRLRSSGIGFTTFSMVRRQWCLAPGRPLTGCSEPCMMTPGDGALSQV